MFLSEAVLPGSWWNHTAALARWPLDFAWPSSQWRCPGGTKNYPRPDSTSQYSREIAFYRKCHPSSAEARKLKPLPRAGADILSNWMLPGNLTAGWAAGDKRWGDKKPSWKRMPGTLDSISEEIRCVSNALPIFNQSMHSETSQHTLF